MLDRRSFLLGLAAVAVSPRPALAADQPIPGRADAVRLTDEQWRARLDPQAFYVLREAGTERAFTGKWWDHHADGVYVCRGCRLPLFDSRTKYESGTGWPSYWQPIAKDAVALRDDSGWFTTRTEVLCNRCGGHLGHVFDDGPRPTGKRYCMNSAALDFVPRASFRG